MSKINLNFDAGDDLYLWNCCLTDIEYFGGYSYFRVTGRGSSIKAYIGYAHNELWICFPELYVACTLADVSDYFWNLEELYSVLQSLPVAITVATALKLFYHDLIKLPF